MFLKLKKMEMKNIFKIISIFWGLSMILIQDCHAYPHFIKNGYNNCIGCHYNPFGGGMLTPYGKGISATQSLISKELTEEEEEKLSSDKYLQSIQFRALHLQTSSKKRTFPMQLEYMSRYVLNKSSAFNLTLSVAPPKENADPNLAPRTHERIYARALEFSYQYDSKNTYLFGINNLPIGLGLIDHTNYVRSFNRLNVTDIPISFRNFFIEKEYSYNYFLYMPHFQESTSNKEYGLGGQYFISPSKNLSLGFQSNFGKSKSIDRSLAGLLLKFGVGSVSFLHESNYTHRKIKSDDTQFGQVTYYEQLQYHLNDWSLLGYAYQGLIRDRDFSGKEYRHSLYTNIKLNRLFTLSYEARIRTKNNQDELSHLVQGFLQWW